MMCRDGIAQQVYVRRGIPCRQVRRALHRRNRALRRAERVLVAIEPYRSAANRRKELRRSAGVQR
jgi:hypothetical protein